MGASAPPALPAFEARESIANSAAPRNDNDTYFDNGDGAFHCETPLCSGSRPLDKTARPNRSFILRHATSIQRINEGAVLGMGARGDAHFRNPKMFETQLRKPRALGYTKVAADLHRSSPRRQKLHGNWIDPVRVLYVRALLATVSNLLALQRANHRRPQWQLLLEFSHFPL